MLTYLLNYITDSGRTALTSVAGAITGQIAFETSALTNINTAFQHAAWSVAILAGIMTMVNLFFPLRTFYDNRKKDEKKNPD